MKLGLINSAWAQAGKETAYGIWMTREIGFDTIDIFLDPLDASDMEIKLVKNECERAKLPIVSVACVALGLVDFNPSVQRFHVNRVQSYLDMARTFGAKNVLLVLGEYVWQREVIPPAEQWAAGVKNLRTLGEYAAELGVGIAMEMEPFHQSLLNDVPKMARFLDDVGHPAVKANIDISHMVLANQDASTLQQLKGPGSSCAYLRLRWQGPRRPSARPRGGRVRAVSRSDPRPRGGQRHYLDRAGVFARAGSDRRLGPGGVRRDRGLDATGGPSWMNLAGRAWSFVLGLALMAAVGWPTMVVILRAIGEAEGACSGRGDATARAGLGVDQARRRDGMPGLAGGTGPGLPALPYRSRGPTCFSVVPC